MSEEQYSNREIQEFFRDIKQGLLRIETQTIKTNDRVGKLENWRSYVSGSIAIISLVVLPAVAFLALNIFSISKEISAIMAILKIQ